MFPLRLRCVAGYEGRVNDAIFQPARRPATGPAPCDQQTLVFFGGDVQDYPEVMQMHRDNCNYQHWNLERTARVLGQSFPDRHILVVRPARIEFKSFSCYDNFVPSNNAGVPEHTPTHNALKHLERLLANVSARLRQLPAAEMMTPALPEHIDIEDLHSHQSTADSNGASSSPHKP